jgi:aspartate-semialdehyde dehydrogenase
VLRVAVVGATGAVGREVCRLLDERVPEVGALVPFASAASAGRDLAAEWGLRTPTAPVGAVDGDAIAGADVAVLCAGIGVSLALGDDLAASGCLVVDNSSAFRMRDDVPLVVPEVNPEAIATRPASGIVANPNCSTIQLVRVLDPLRRAAGLEAVDVATYQAASGGGLRGLAEVQAATADLLAGGDGGGGRGGRFGQPLALNLVPQIGALDGDGMAHEEHKLRREPRKILALPELRVTATAVRVPVLHCHSEAVTLRLGRPVPREGLEAVLAATSGLCVHRSSDRPPFPMPRFVARCDDGRARVHVGRVRVDAEDPRTVQCWIVADNLWVGAALNATGILAHAVGRGWLG